MNIKVHKKSEDLTSCCSTESDSCEDRDQEIVTLKTNPLKHKTELCKNFSENGYCPYKNKCRFAHGYHQLVCQPIAKSFRKKRCNGFWNYGFCSYGMRCQFGHEAVEWQTQAYLSAVSSVFASANVCRGSKLMVMLNHY